MNEQTTIDTEATNSVLELATGDPQKPARLVVIDGESYALLETDQISIKDHLRMQRVGKLLASMDDIEKVAEMTDEEIDAAVKGTEQFIQTVLPTAPIEVLRKLTGAQQISIVAAFIEGATTEADASSPTNSSASQPQPDSGESQSPPSENSTPA